jgi:hypothetical protein
LTAWSLAGISLGTAVLWARAWRTRRDTLRLVAHAHQAAARSIRRIGGYSA